MNILQAIKATVGHPGPIGVFDSGYGGLTILNGLREALPDADYLYLGDNARAPYGNRSFDLVYQFTLEAVRYLFARGCHLVILACNTASAKALRSIQQHDLPLMAPHRRVLGVIRPTAEAVATASRNGHVALFATPGTVASHSFDMELVKLFPGAVLTSHACPMWVPLVEYGEARGDGADYFVRRDIETVFDADPLIDTVILGCTHYPLLIDTIRGAIPTHVDVLSQGNVVADSLADYLRRHPDMAARCTEGGSVRYLTTESADRFSSMASIFMADSVEAQQIEL